MFKRSTTKDGQKESDIIRRKANLSLALRTKPHTNSWLYLSPRVGTLGEDAFEHTPALIKEIHEYLK